jgi:hypothetical protein
MSFADHLGERQLRNDPTGRTSDLPSLLPTAGS